MLRLDRKLQFILSSFSQSLSDFYQNEWLQHVHCFLWRFVLFFNHLRSILVFNVNRGCGHIYIYYILILICFSVYGVLNLKKVAG